MSDCCHCTEQMAQSLKMFIGKKVSIFECCNQTVVIGTITDVIANKVLVMEGWNKTIFTKEGTQKFGGNTLFISICDITEFSPD